MRLKLITRNRTTNGIKKTFLYFEYKDETGKQVRKSLGLEDSRANRKKANEILLPKLEEAIKSELFFKNNYVPTVDEYFETSLLYHKSERHFRTEKMIVKGYEYHIKETFGKTKITEVKYRDIAL